MSIDNYISDLKEKYLRASTELGRAVETEAAGYSDIRKFLDKVRRSEFAGQDPELFILSRSGLTEQARNLAIKNKIHVLNPSLRV